jgi:hypothetical protein
MKMVPSSERMLQKKFYENNQKLTEIRAAGHLRFGLKGIDSSHADGKLKQF